MTGLPMLWLPILLSSVIVFIVSSVIHMASPWHKKDYPAVPNEDQLMNVLRPLGIPPGDYLVPRAKNTAEMRSPDVLWFLYAMTVGVFVAYVTGRALPPGAPYLRVFRFAGVTAFLGYSVALWQMSIWYRRGWSMTAKATVDGLIYALLTAGTFGWLWPQ